VATFVLFAHGVHLSPSTKYPVLQVAGVVALAHVIALVSHYAAHFSEARKYELTHLPHFSAVSLQVAHGEVQGLHLNSVLS